MCRDPVLCGQKWIVGLSTRWQTGAGRQCWGSMRMSRRGEIEPSFKTPEPFAEERASRRRKIINKIMNVIVVVGIAIDLFFAILYSVLDTRAYFVAIGVNLATAALWAMTPLFHRWPGPFAGVWFLGVFIAAMLSFTLLLGHA